MLRHQRTALIDMLSDDSLAIIASFFLVGGDDVEDLRDGIEQRWHKLHALCGRSRIKAVLLEVTSGALEGSGDSFKTWFYQTTLPSVVRSIPLRDTGPEACFLYDAHTPCAFPYLMQLEHTVCRHRPSAELEGRPSWKITWRSHEPSAAAARTTTLLSSAESPELHLHEALLLAFRQHPIGAHDLLTLSAKRAETERKTRVPVTFWRALWRMARHGSCGARHLVDWKSAHPLPFRDVRTAWPEQSDFWNKPSGNISLTLQSTFPFPRQLDEFFLHAMTLHRDASEKAAHLIELTKMYQNVLLPLIREDPAKRKTLLDSWDPRLIHPGASDTLQMATDALRIMETSTRIVEQLLGICDLFEEDHARLRAVFHAKSHAKEDVQRAIEHFPRTVGEVRMLLGEDV